ncbi:hypothetical protein ACKVMT_13655 [Halobacteriales archaeon Cl-PHB]
MSWTHSSKTTILAVLLAVSLVAVGTAGAISVSADAPDQTQVGESVSATVTISDPFEDQPDQWTLQGTSGLDNASWTVTTLQQGSTVETNQYAGDNFTQDLSIDSGVDEVQIEVSGAAPALNSFDYEEMSAENYTVATVARNVDGTANAIESFTAHRYTVADGDAPNSLEARQAIDAAIDANGGTNDKIDQAISSYDAGNFQNAVSLAEEAESSAGTSSLLLIGAGVVVLLALVAGGYYYWQSRQQTNYKLQ